MGSKIVLAVMHCTEQEPKAVIALGIKVRDAMYSPAGVLLYSATSNPITAANFAGYVSVADSAQGNVKNRGTSATTARNTGVAALFTALGKLLLYANGLYKGNKTNLEAAGFDTSADPSPHPVPDAPVIKTIINGPLAHTAKIMLAKVTSILNKKKESVTYIVQMNTVNSAVGMTTVLTIKNQRKLVIPGLTRGKEIFFQISKSNAAGESPFSPIVGFVPQ